MPTRSLTDPLFSGPDAESPLAVLKRVYGYPAFRGRQAEVVSHVVSGGDAVVLFPTGAGKSLCFQVPALCRPGVGVVVLAADRADARPGGGTEGSRGQSGGAQFDAFP